MSISIEGFRPVLPRTSLIAAADAFFEVIKHDYREYRQRGMFVQSEDPCFMVYHLREGGSSYCGLIVALPPGLYRNGLIKRHEGTLAASEQQQLQLLVLRRALVKPVLLTYPAVPQIDALLQNIVETQEPTLSLTDSPDITHTLYAVSPTSEPGQQLQAAFAKTVDALYIADGHHRCSTVDLYNRQLEAAGETPIPLLAGLFSSDQVQVRAYHRVVNLDARLSPLSLLARLSALCTIAPLASAAAPEHPGELTLLLQGEVFRLRWRPEVLPEHGISLDAGLFNALIAEPIFGITDVRTNERIHYVPGAFGVGAVLELTQRRTERAGFLLHGIEPRDMFAVVDAGMIMPPKSTWFEPRLRNGLTVLDL